MSSFVGFADVQRGAVDVGIDGHGPDVHLAQRADDADCDLSTIRNEDFAEHGQIVAVSAGAAL